MIYLSNKSFNPNEPRDFGLSTVKNKSTGSLFHVIGTLPQGIRVSFRLWTVYSSVGGVSLPFRVRFGDVEGVVEKGFDVAVSLRTKYPKAPFGAGSTALISGAHTSMEGVIRFKTPAYEIARIQHLLEESKFAATLRDSLIEAMPEIDLIPLDQLSEFILAYAGDELGLRIPAPPTDTDIQFSLGWGGEALFNTFKEGEPSPLSSSGLESHTPDSWGTSSVGPIPKKLIKKKLIKLTVITDEEVQKALQADAGL